MRETLNRRGWFEICPLYSRSSDSKAICKDRSIRNRINKDVLADILLFWCYSGSGFSFHSYKLVAVQGLFRQRIVLNRRSSRFAGTGFSHTIISRLSRSIAR